MKINKYMCGINYLPAEFGGWLLVDESVYLVQTVNNDFIVHRVTKFVDCANYSPAVESIFYSQESDAISKYNEWETELDKRCHTNK